VTPLPAYQYGVLLPHFGTHTSRERLLTAAREAERYEFDAVWVRDHVVFHPHPHEDQSRTHVDPFMVLSAVATVTERIVLGMGTLIPHRHPIHAALSVGCLDFLAGPGRVIVGLGIGGYASEFEALGMGGLDRRELAEEQVAIFRKLWSGETVTHTGKHYRFADVAIRPVPASPVPVWYGGTSQAAVRRAVEYCDGWIPGRMPFIHLRRLIGRMRQLAEAAGKPVPTTGVIPFVVPARTVEAGLAALDVPNLLGEAAEKYPGEFRSIKDLAGAVVAGPRDVIVETVRASQAEGVQHFVFDMRPRFAEFPECLRFIGEEVLPTLHREDGRPGR
jgi:probable F420-dependent oxidoreductase